MSTDELVAHLRAMADGVESGDTFEGKISFGLRGSEWNAAGAYRICNTRGQGALRLIDDWDDSEPEER